MNAAASSASEQIDERRIVYIAPSTGIMDHREAHKAPRYHETLGACESFAGYGKAPGGRSDGSS